MSSSSKILLVSSVAAVLFLMVILDQPGSAVAFGKGHGHHKGADGTACIVKGSYCSCHYCKCEKGWVHCGHKHGHGKNKI